ncbi:hypothetical protein L1887_43380 [Cichorium endivia]|nr:hypothetical protein L1887_43380 [Cichorium endivia]
MAVRLSRQRRQAIQMTSSAAKPVEKIDPGTHGERQKGPGSATVAVVAKRKGFFGLHDALIARHPRHGGAAHGLTGNGLQLQHPTLDLTGQTRDIPRRPPRLARHGGPRRAGPHLMMLRRLTDNRFITRADTSAGPGGACSKISSRTRVPALLRQTFLTGNAGFNSDRHKWRPMLSGPTLKKMLERTSCLLSSSSSLGTPLRVPLEGVDINA